MGGAIRAAGAVDSSSCSIRGDECPPDKPLLSHRIQPVYDPTGRVRRRYTGVSGVHCFGYPTGADEKLDKHDASAGARAREAVNIMLANPVDHCLADKHTRWHKFKSPAGSIVNTQIPSLLSGV